MRYALIAFCEFMLREVRDEAARVAAGRPPAGPRACDGIRAAEAEGAAAAAPAPPAPQADKEHGKEGGGRRAAISLSAAAASTGGAGGDAPGPAPLKRSVTFAAGTRDAAGAVKGRPATAGHRRVRSITALCLVGGALGGGAPGGGDVLRAHSAPRPRPGPRAGALLALERMHAPALARAAAHAGRGQRQSRPGCARGSAPGPGSRAARAARNASARAPDSTPRAAGLRLCARGDAASQPERAVGRSSMLGWLVPGFPAPGSWPVALVT